MSKSIFSDTEQAIAAGKRAFHDYATALAAGPGSRLYERRISRPTGPDVVPGAILACIGTGITREDDIIHAAARSAICQRPTVRRILRARRGSYVGRHLWAVDRSGRYYDLNSAVNRVISHPETPPRG